MSSISIAFGAMSDPVEKQLNEQGYTLGMSAPMYERAAENITYLRIQGYLTPAQVDSARKKLIKKLADAAVVMR